MSKEEINELFEKFNHLNILVIGDVMIDTYFWGKVERISPEAPVPIISRSDIEHRLGGAGNVALNVQALGATPYLCSVIGNDDKSIVLKNLLKKRGLSDTGVVTDDNRITTIKTRVISDNQHLLRIDEEITDNISAETQNKFIDRLKTIIAEKKIDAIIFEDYDKGVITEEIIKAVVELTGKKGIPTLVDPKKRNFMSYHGVTLFKPNFKELVEGLKLDIEKNDIEGLHKASNQLRENLNIKMVMATLSELGIYISDNGSYHNIPAEVRDIADVSGAGDTVISTASLCLAAGLSPKNVACLSNLAGGLVCEKVGVVPVNKELLKEEFLRLKELNYEY
ncbi:MAG: bifunctional ADP-heptose synthase [Bacteroidota bacterium]